MAQSCVGGGRAVHPIKCKLNTQDNLIGKVLFFSPHPDRHRVEVEDHWIYQVHHHSIFARIDTDNAARTTFSWRLDGVPLRGGGASLTNTYSATFLKSTMRMNVYAGLSGADNSENGYGPCTIVPPRKK